ncbi:hypothetical protein BJ322DRAFT_1113424 [Thelephora terrestris]|uniref:Uncharacterized protein n=1 Tax=Thelephora terrestris TaxID=56493 RepID=A0A9P6H5S4_9AGAM|nr:hypothetical protein BJ322DRAFT_1113424 [Thelephora terrestris]
MASNSRRSGGRDGVLPKLDVALLFLSGAKDSRGFAPAQIALGTACVLLTMIRDTMGSKQDFVDLGLFCVKSVHKAIAQLTTTMAEIQGNVTQKGKQSWVSGFGFVNARGDKGAIAGWTQALTMVLDVFETELLINVHVVAERVERKLDVFVNREGARQHLPAQASIPPGESPPPAPNDFFGRDDLIEEIIYRAEKLESIALIGAGGIGKTSIALTALSTVLVTTAASSVAISSLLRVAMILILDNAESILDPQGTDAGDIYSVVEELSQFSNICLGITSRISTIPPHIYSDGGRSRIIDDLLQQLDCHALSIKLLATAASHNMWDHDRLAQEWRTHRTQALRTNFNESLAAILELSLASPTFCNLGPDARELLEVVAFFPQGINENNLDWFFPTISNRRDIFDDFCVLSLTSRSSGFITMLAPIRDYLYPQHPTSAPLLYVHPEKPGFGESRWITLEDVNVEHLLDVFTPKDAKPDGSWDVCFHFMEHLVWHKPRRTVLGPKVEGLSDDHHSKPKCLFELARLFYGVRNLAEARRLLTCALQLGRQRADEPGVAQTLRWLIFVNGLLSNFKEGIRQAREAIEIRERLGDTIGQADCCNYLAFALFDDGQIIDQGQQSLVCESHQALGVVYNSKGDTEKAIHHFEKGLEIASAFSRPDLLFEIRFDLALAFCGQGKFNDASAHLGQVKLDAGNSLYYLGSATEAQAGIWYRQSRLEDAKSERYCAMDGDESEHEDATESHSTHVHVQRTSNPIKHLREYFSRR